MNKALLWFVKITGLPLSFVYFHKKIYFESNDKTLRKIKGPAIIVSNHTSVFDFPLIMYTFMSKTVRTLVAEGIYKYKALGRLMKGMGNVKVDRKNHDFSFISTMSEFLKKGHICLIFPESRLHTPQDPPGLLEFKPSYVYLALQNNVPIIPVYTNGMYGKKRHKNKDRARIIVGKPILPTLLLNNNKSEKENIQYINNYIRDKIIWLGDELTSQVKSHK